MPKKKGKASAGHSPEVKRIFTGALSEGQVAEFRISDHDTQPESCGVGSGAIDDNRPAGTCPPETQADMICYGMSKGQSYSRKDIYPGAEVFCQPFLIKNRFSQHFVSNDEVFGTITDESGSLSVYFRSWFSVQILFEIAMRFSLLYAKGQTNLRQLRYN